MFDSSESGGVGEGQGTTDVSNQIDGEEQVRWIQRSKISVRLKKLGLNAILVFTNSYLHRP